VEVPRRVSGHVVVSVTGAHRATRSPSGFALLIVVRIEREGCGVCSRGSGGRAGGLDCQPAPELVAATTPAPPQGG